MSRILEGLNQAQIEAVTHRGGPLLILAGAGSGKTKVITHRIAFLLEQKIAQPDNILAVTFTNKAAEEMKDRIKKLLGDVRMPWMGTFHSICAKILRRELHAMGRPSDFSILSAQDQLSVVRECFRELNLDDKKFSPEAILNSIGALKCQLKDPETFATSAHGIYPQTVASVYSLYEEKLKAQNALDFDDLITKTVFLLNNNEETLKKYQSLFTQILIDEYQDVNYSQYCLAKALADKHRNICVVGDDDQSIYGFRGADVSIILRFENDFEDARVIKLEENYRSTGTIIEAANAVASKNKLRKEKTLWTKKPAGEKISMNVAIDAREEARYVVKEIKNRVKHGANYKDFAILYRTNSQSRSIEEALFQEGIDYQIVGGLRFYERKEIKDIIAYLKFIINHRDHMSFRRIINIPSRGIGNVTQDKIIAESVKHGISLVEVMKNSHKIERIGKKIQETLSDFAAMTELLAEEKDKMSPSAFIEMVIEELNYKSIYNTGKAEDLERLENINEFIAKAKEFEMTSQDNSIYAFLEKISLISDIDEKEDEKQNNKGKVVLMTLHSAKGLEFPVVFIVGVEEGLLPHYRSTQEGKESLLEEERRLFYVGITRATKKLYLTFARERIVQGKTHNQSPSRFLREIPETLVDRYIPELSQRSFTRKITSALDKPRTLDAKQVGFTVGDAVYHKIFGKGMVLSIAKGFVTVEFNGVGKKTLSSEFLTPYLETDVLKCGDKVSLEDGTEGIIKELDGEFAYLILDGPVVEKVEKRRLSLKKE